MYYIITYGGCSGLDRVVLSSGSGVRVLLGVPRPGCVPSPSGLTPCVTKNATLLCLILGFFPADIKVHWEMNGTKMDPSQYSNSPVVWFASAGSYSMHSKVLVPQSQWQEGKYSCIVSHESSQVPLTRNITNAFGK
uniref:Ig-like domain-containing protein n=1 Tax=Scleropages formosus TaxID=113540 RepID=A0A8C9U5D3_SCLFO